MAKYTSLIYKLTKGLAAKGEVILINQNQFYSESQRRHVTMFVVYETTYDENKKKRIQTEAMRTATQVDVVIYLSNRLKGFSPEEALTFVDFKNERQAKTKKELDIKRPVIVKRQH